MEKPTFVLVAPADEVKVNAVWDVVNDRVEKLSAAFPPDVRTGIIHAEFNFWSHPYQTYHGGVPVALVYPDDPSAMPSLCEMPPDVDGPDVIPFLVGLGRKHRGKMVVYSATGIKDNLLVLVVFPSLLYKLSCPIITTGTSYTLGKWQIERHDGTEVRGAGDP